MSNMFWCSKERPRKLQLAQKKAAHLTLNWKHRTNINNMHDSLSWLMVEEKLATSLLLFLRNISVLEMPSHL
jgi:hypothetical protein